MRDARTNAMGNWEADHASPIGAPANAPAASQPPQAWSEAATAAPASEERARQNTPLWMETPATQPEARRGAAPPRSGLHTWLFFALIVFGVGAAGIGGVALWGPEKPIKNRTQFATNPPPPTELPSLPPTAAAAATPSAVASVAEAAPAAAADSAHVEESPLSKKGKKAPKAWKKRR